MNSLADLHIILGMSPVSLSIEVTQLELHVGEGVLVGGLIRTQEVTQWGVSYTNRK